MIPLFNTVGILGVGLIGGSLGMALRRAGAAGHVIGIGRDKGRLLHALDLGALDEVSLSLAEVAHRLDLLVLCTPVGIMAEMVLPALDHFKQGVLITDAGSTKAEVVHRMEECLKGKAYFVGSHPMAGSEKTGAANGSATLYHGATCVVTPTANSNPDAVTKVSHLWESVGGKVVFLTPEEHDVLVARTSHLPHLAAVAIVLAVLGEKNDKVKDLLGEGFRDTTRVAAGDPVMWRDICLDNAKEINETLGRFEEEIHRLREAVSKGDAAGLMELLTRAQKARLGI